VLVQHGATLAELPVTPIEDQFAKHYDYEMKAALTQTKP
jgi:hypothetical protein